MSSFFKPYKAVIVIAGFAIIDQHHIFVLCFKMIAFHGVFLSDEFSKALKKNLIVVISLFQVKRKLITIGFGVEVHTAEVVELVVC